MSKYDFTFYFDGIDKILKEIRETQEDAILEAGKLVSNCIKMDGLAHTFGTGHSHALAEDVFFRAGTLAPISEIYDTSLAGSIQVVKSTYVERLEGYAEILMDYVKTSPEDVFIIISNSGRNAVPIEMAMEAKKRDNEVIAVTSLTYSKNISSRHSSGKKLYEIADVVLDNCGKMGDIAVEVTELPQGIGPTSTVTGSYLLHAVMVQAIFNLLEQDIEPPVFWSGNLDQGMEKNQKLLERYWDRIRNW